MGTWFGLGILVMVFTLIPNIGDYIMKGFDYIIELIKMITS